MHDIDEANTRRQVVLGAGQVGTVLAQILVARGHRVMQVRRGGGAPVPGATLRSGDLADRAFAGDALRGAAVVYDCVNPAYDQWPALLPPLRRGILHGVMCHGAKLVQLDNVYMLGAPDSPMTEETPMAPASKKGELRAQLARETLDAASRGDLRVAVLRASDFYGPDFLRASVFGPHFYERVLLGRTAYCQGNPEMPHSYAYGPDVAAAMATLGAADDDVLGQIWHAPCAPAEASRVTMQRFAAPLGVPVRVRPLPDWMLRAAGVFAPLLREGAEMTYQWKKPFVVDDAKWRARFGDRATTLEAGVAATARWALGKYARREA